MSWLAYRLVDKGWTTLGEVDGLSLEYIEEANQVLDAIEDAQADQAERQEKG